MKFVGSWLAGGVMSDSTGKIAVPAIYKTESFWMMAPGEAVLGTAG